MKRSQMNEAMRYALAAFKANHWHLPPNPRWDVTDFGLGDFKKYGLVLVNLADEPEYCEKLMYARQNQITPTHCHAHKRKTLLSARGIWLFRYGQPSREIRKAYLKFR